MDNLRNLWHKLTMPHSTDEAEALREYMVKVVLTIASALMLTATLLSAIGWSAALITPDIAFEILLITLVIVGAWWLAHRGHWHLGSHILLTLLLLEATYTNYVEGPGTSATLYYALLMLLSSMFHGGRAYWTTLVFSIGTYLGIGWLHARGYLPPTPAPRTEFAIWALNISVTFTGIALLQHFATRQVERALAQSHSYAVGLAEQIAERQWAEEALQEQAHFQELLIETAHHLTASLDARDVLHRIGDQANKILDGHHCIICLLEADGQTLTPVVAIDPLYEKEILAASISVEGSLTGRAVKARKGLIFNGGEGEPGGQYIPGTPVEPKERIIVTPFIADGEVLGAMCLSRLGTIFSPNDLILAEAFAAYAALALRNAQTHNALRQSEEKFSRIFRASPDSIIVSSLVDGRYIDVNDSFLHVTGYRREEVIGYTADDLNVWANPQDRARFVQMLREQGNVRGLEASFRIKSGEMLTVLVSSEAIELDGESCLLTISKDITERKQVEQALRHTHDELEQRVAERTAELSDVNTLLRRDIAARQRAEWALYKAKEEAEQARHTAESASQAKSVFLAQMSHELRTPLNAIMGFSELMTHDSNLTYDQQENLKTINRSGEHLLTLINDVLELSKIEAGRAELQEESFDLHHMLANLEGMFRLHAARKGLTLTVERAHDVPQYISADVGKLRQILINLLGNAVKFTHAGGVTLRVKQASVTINLPSSDSRFLNFEVEDTGMGIAPEELGAVFDAFVQTKRSQDVQQGTGLGVPISREFVRLMGGELVVESPCWDGPAHSSPGGPGSRFKFNVHVRLITQDETQELQSQTRKRAIGLQSGQPTFRLLVVEDVDASRELLTNMLLLMGFDVREATNGQEAIEVWEEWEPHLIWMDIRMPVLDGYETTRHIKATPQGQDTIIVALTASAFEEDRAAILAEGCDDFVRKPIREADIFNTLAQHLSVRFVYQEIEADAKSPAEEREKQVEKSIHQEALSMALAMMPPQWMVDIRQAVVDADLDWIITLINQIRERDASVASALLKLTHNFEYDEILHLIEQAATRQETGV